MMVKWSVYSLLKIRLRLFEFWDFVTKTGVWFFHMLRRISKTIYDFCLKLYTLPSYINLKISILFGDESKFYFTVIVFFVKKKVLGVLMLRCISETIYENCITLNTQDDRIIMRSWCNCLLFLQFKFIVNSYLHYSLFIITCIILCYSSF